MADIEFDPATEFQVLETFNFEEAIQRPESLRFYTLDEQLLDYVEKSMPEGKATRYQIQELQRARDRIQEAYLGVIDPNFELRPQRVQTMPRWIHPIYSDFEYNAFDYNTQWTPVLEQRNIPNYYPRMILSLPKPYITKDDGSPSITQLTKAVNEKGIQAIGLGNYERTKTVIHENGILDVLPLPIQNTSDDMRIRGYALDKRPYDVPNPLAEHPFFNTSQASKVITNEPFLDIFPSINAILTHGVPTTTDPYTEGSKYLKLYDVNFSDISWELWRRRFPPVDSIETSPPAMSVKFPNPEAKLPSENLKKVYTQFYPGVDPYTWLMNQEDGGAFVPRMLLSKASESGLLPVIPIGEIVEPQFPNSTPEECLNTESFDSFLNSGIYRDGKCLPVSYIQHERQTLISQGRKAWRESTEMDILRDYQIKLLHSSRVALPNPEVKYDKYEAREVPELRREILVVKADPKRLDIDKVKDISLLVENILPTDRVFLDTKGSFLLCEHTIELLKEPVMDTFYREWTFIESGYRVCKFCGEQINRDVFLAQDDFDESGHVVISHEKLPTNIHTSDTNVSEFTKSLADLKGIFELDKGKHAGRTILYLLLSLFRVVPLESQLLPVLTFMDGISAAFKSAKKGSDELDGAIGIVGMAILLQTHNPFLIPSRSFGSNRLKLSGYPRDTDDSKQVPVVTTIIFVLESAFDSFPHTFTGPIGAFMRYLTTSSKKVRSTAISLLGKSTQKFKVQFEDAKIRFSTIPEDLQSLPLRIPKKYMFTPSEFVMNEAHVSCSIPRALTYLAGKLPPSVSQQQLSLQPNLKPSRASIPVFPRKYQEFELVTIPTDSLRSRIQKGFPKDLKVPLLSAYVESEKDGIALLTLLSRILDIFKNDIDKEVLATFRGATTHLQTRISGSLLRDSAKGIIYQLLHIIAKDEQLSKKLLLSVKQDIGLKMLITKKEDALKEDQGLRARERELLKSRLRQKNDAEREIIKMLLDIGIAAYIITNKDREQFAKEFEDSVVEDVEEERPEGEYDTIQGQDMDYNVEDNENGMRYSRDEDYGMVGTQMAEETD
jgi:hypothetical protein